MAAPRYSAPVLWVRGTSPVLKSLFTLDSKPFCSTAAASRPLSAQQLAEKLRAQKREQKTKKQPVPTTPVQRRVQELVRFTQQLQRVHPNVLAKALSRGILHQDKDLVVINKPYGLPVHGGPGVQLCISEVLPILAKMFHGHKAEPLHLCHRLDKETTGVMVLAWEKEVAHQVQELFRTRQVEKKYWAVTVRVPVPSAGVVDIPIIEKEVQGQQQHHKMTLCPSYRMDNGKMVKVRTSRNAQIAVTQYQVLSSTVSSALVELHPVTGIKHQLRVHLSFGLDCPVLGDHKYSDWNRLAPQVPARPGPNTPVAARVLPTTEGFPLPLMGREGGGRAEGRQKAFTLAFLACTLE
ncbi:RNA pseudouridylate synthase domain-containing protein 4 isoform X2 [Heterocephalus glaber]|uniref:Pseudouridylate synthase RPUSD4, mitochondrial n=1 Tax=Heterocephalus glaber TaxID=10181 RepID=A0AAX6RRR2_HETGA|nr:RNA pseudouridylate synthase domain-containing protein 4 isoform X2 [Heterocephalus glaber]